MNDLINNLLIFFENYSNKLINENVLESFDFKKINIDFFSNSKKGDVSSNFFLITNKRLVNKDFKLRDDLLHNLNQLKYIETSKIPNSGFVDIFFKKSFLFNELKDVLNNDSNYGSSKYGNNKKINIEFVSANPTGPIHIGHIRGAVFGDILASLLEKTGYIVTREYYINDAGTQINILGESLFKRYCEIFGEDIKLNNDEYPGEYLITIAKEIYDKDKDKWLNHKKEETIEYFKKFALNKIIDGIKNDLSLLNIKFDEFIFESEIEKSKLIDELFILLNNKKLLYEGTLEKPKGEDNLNWKPRKQLLFKSTDLFDDRDRAFQKENGEWTYFANDAAYHYNKFLRKFDKLINIWGADHIGYIPRMKSVVSSFSNHENYLEILTCQIVRLFKNKEIIKMSKREGNFITLNEVYKSVGKDPLRYFMISTRNETTMDFDINKVLEKNKDNPVFYCQYAYARSSSVINKAKELKIENNYNEINTANIENYISNHEWDIILKILCFPYVLHQASINREPHRITIYLENLSTAFHSFWNKGKEDEFFRFLDDKNLIKTKLRIIWLKSFKITLKNCFEIIGIESPESM